MDEEADGSGARTAANGIGGRRQTSGRYESATKREGKGECGGGVLLITTYALSKIASELALFYYYRYSRVKVDIMTSQKKVYTKSEKISSINDSWISFWQRASSTVPGCIISPLSVDSHVKP